MQRRDLLKTAAAAPLLLGAQSPAKKYTLALIGTGWWGGNILGEALRSGECKLVGLCDVDENQLETTASKVKQVSSDEPRKYRDYRELLKKEKPDCP